MSRDQLLIVGAFFVTYFVWGSTYLANYWAIQTLPVFGMGGARFLTAGVLLYALSIFVGAKHKPTFSQFKNAGLIGVLFLTLGTGTVVWAQQWVPTSTTALIISFEPLLVMLVMWVFFRSRPPAKAFLGAAVSIAGMFLLINQPTTISGEGMVPGLIGIVFGMCCWAFGMTLSPRLDMGKNKFRATAMQMLVGGSVLLAFSFLVNDWEGFTLAQVSTRSALAWGFLVIFGAILAFSAFNFLLSKVSPDKASTNTYVNPVVAVALGALLNGESVTTQTMVAGAVMLAGVYFIQSAGKEEEGEEVENVLGFMPEESSIVE
ncbi:EamA family transporter [Neolewinella antarctica]|uniref:Drug/metabolite transporter (DMT)-like permease n=1 Tax=Neolewinella antarctica TaxID=442734 RepID=A0ABX0XAC5_9BACT|nr:EamA family transporter [Neolewinella antarctica]NJC26172.1 drug/metabolite transporter (DMT)-like permease [Neolewinella antarctica]